MTSLAQCRLLYIRETPTKPAPPYIAGPVTHFQLGHQREVSFATAAAAANAATEWPDGKDRYMSPPLIPRPSCHFSAFKSVLSVGRCTWTRDRENKSLTTPP